MGRKQSAGPSKERLGTLVLAERQAIQARLAAFHQGRPLQGRGVVVSDRTPTADFIEVVNEGVAKELECASTGVLVARLKALERAEGKIRKGTYGICEACDEPIPASRLRALPEATLCTPCAEKVEQRRPSPPRRGG